MPELPEVETVCRGLDRAVTGKTIVHAQNRRPNMRFPFPEGLQSRLTGQRISRIYRRAKFGLIELANSENILFHLGMSGRMRIDPDRVKAESELGKHDHFYMAMDDGTVVTFNDPRRFGFLDVIAAGEMTDNRFLRSLGIEPLSNSFNADALSDMLRNKATPIKSALLDQRLIAGLGNIYVCEALFMARISPRRKASTVAGKRAQRLAPAIREVLQKAIESGGSTLRDYAHVDGQLGYFQHAFQVYGREGDPCVTQDCSAKIRRIVQSGRSTFFCSRCQK